MSNDQHHLDSWLEPDLEARVVSLVVGEASDFERSELERLMREEPELEVFRRRMTAVHALVGEALAPLGSGGKSSNGEDWRLAGGRRKAVLERIGAVQAGNGAPPGNARLAASKKRLSWPLLTVAASLALAAAIASMMTPMYSKVGSRNVAAANDFSSASRGETAYSFGEAEAGGVLAEVPKASEELFAKGSVAWAESERGYRGGALPEEWDAPDSNRSRAAIDSLGTQLGSKREKSLTVGKPAEGYGDRDGDGNADEMVRSQAGSVPGVAQDPAAVTATGVAGLEGKGDAGATSAGDLFAGSAFGGVGGGQGAARTSGETALATALDDALMPEVREFEGFVSFGNEATKEGETRAKDSDDLADWSGQVNDQTKEQLGEIDPVSSAGAGFGWKQGQAGGGSIGGVTGLVAGRPESLTELELQRQHDLTPFFRDSTAEGPASAEWARNEPGRSDSLEPGATNGYARLNEESAFGQIAGIDLIGREAEGPSGPAQRYDDEADFGVEDRRGGPGEGGRGVSSDGRSLLSNALGIQPSGFDVDGSALSPPASDDLAAIKETSLQKRDSEFGMQFENLEQGLAESSGPVSFTEAAPQRAADTETVSGDLQRLAQRFAGEESDVAEQPMDEALAQVRDGEKAKADVATANWHYQNGREALGGDMNAALDGGSGSLDNKDNLYDIPKFLPAATPAVTTGPVAAPAPAEPPSSPGRFLATQPKSPEVNADSRPRLSTWETEGKGERGSFDETITFSRSLRSSSGVEAVRAEVDALRVELLEASERYRVVDIDLGPTPEDELEGRHDEYQAIKANYEAGKKLLADLELGEAARGSDPATEAEGDLGARSDAAQETAGFNELARAKLRYLQEKSLLQIKEAKVAAESIDLAMPKSPIVIHERAEAAAAPRSLWETLTGRARRQVARAKLQLNPPSRDFRVMESSEESDASRTSPAIAEAQREVATSDETLSRVVEDLNLDAQWGLSNEKAVEKLRAGLQVKPEGTGDLVQVQFEDHDSEIAKNVTDRVVQVWSDRIRELETGLKTGDLEEIASLLEQQRTDVEKARMELLELAEVYGITDLDSEGLADLATSSGTREHAPEPPLPEMTATAEEPFSTFSLHVADVSFKMARAALLEKGEFPPADSVRVEEFVNAFDYGDPCPSYEEKVTGRIEQAAHPFYQQQNLVRIAFRTAALGRAAQQPLRLTLLIDKSGSMEREDREAIVGRALASLSAHLTPADQVTVVTFARTPRLLLEAWTGDRGAELTDLVMRTPPEGGTNMEEALRLAGEKALEQRLDGAQNRIVLISDGAANLGDARPDALRAIVVDLRRQGIAFDACGVGMDEVNDAVLEAVTREGDGRYYLLNRPEDADEGFAKHLAGSLRPAARNVKVQVQFHPERVSRYRLLGFEKHRLQKEDFRNDQVDAAELAGAESGVAVYQVEFAPNGRGPLGEAAVRFQDSASGIMVERSWTIPYQERTPDLKDAAPSMQLAATTAFVAEKLQGGARAETVELSHLAPVLTNLRGAFPTYERVQQLLQMAEVIRQRTE